MKYKGQDVRIGTINENGNLEINKELIEEIDPDNKLGLLEVGEQEKPDLDKALEGIDGKTEKIEKIGHHDLEGLLDCFLSIS